MNDQNNEEIRLFPTVSLRDEVHFYPDAEWPKFTSDSIMENAVVEGSYELQVSREMAITSALGAMAVACQGIINIEQPTGNVINAGLMLLTIAESGERKTTTEKQYFKTIRNYQTKKLEESNIETDKYIYEKELFDIEDNALKSELKRLIKKGEDTEEIRERIKNNNIKKPKEPKKYNFIYEDATPEALIQGMYKNSKNACLISSEGNSIFNGRVLSDLNLINALWDGGYVPFNRVSKDSFTLTNARLTLAVMTQMNVIDNFLTKRGDEARGMGFLARFLVVRPFSMAGKRNTTKRISKLDHINLFNLRIEELLDKSHSLEKEEKEKETISFSPEAIVLWDKLSQEIEKEMQEYGIYEHYTDHASKLMDNISRVSGIIEYFEDTNNNNKRISKETLEFSYKLCLRYSKHFLSYLATEPVIIKNANLLAKFLIQKSIEKNEEIKKQKIQTLTYDNYDEKYINGMILKIGKKVDFTKTDVIQYGPNPLRNDRHDYAALNNAIDLLKRMGYIQESKDKKNHYHFNEATVFSEKSSYGSMTSIFDPKEYTSEKINRLIENTPELNKITEILPEPTIKNGNEYTIKELPLFNQLIERLSYSFSTGDIFGSNENKPYNYIEIKKSRYIIGTDK